MDIFSSIITLKKDLDQFRFICCCAFYIDGENVVLYDESNTRWTSKKLFEYIKILCEIYAGKETETPEGTYLIEFLRLNNVEELVNKNGYHNRMKLLQILEKYKEYCKYVPATTSEEYFIKFYKKNGYGLNRVNNYKKQLQNSNIITIPHTTTGMSAGYIDHFFNYAANANNKEKGYGTNILLLKPLNSEIYIKQKYEMLGFAYEVVAQGTIDDVAFIKKKILPLMSQNAKDSFFKGVYPEGYDMKIFDKHFGEIDKLINNSNHELSKYLSREKKKYGKTSFFNKLLALLSH